MKTPYDNLNTNEYRIEHEYGQVRARIYIQGRRTNAYVLLETDKPKPAFIPDAIWEQAKTTQDELDSQSF